MPWKVTSRMTERAKFVLDVGRPGVSMAELCRLYGISRKTGYQWLRRYRTDGLGALEDRSHRPLHCPHRTAEEPVELLLAERSAHPLWGAEKLLKRLRDRRPDLVWPAVSTASLILRRHGVTKKRRARHRSEFSGSRS